MSVSKCLGEAWVTKFGDTVKLFLERYKINNEFVFFIKPISSSQDYKDLQEKEDMKETELPDEDPACHDTVHNGREVRVCICTGDKCNAASPTNFTSLAFPILSWIWLFLVVQNEN